MAAYDGVLVAAAAALGIPTSLAERPDGLDHEAERLRIEHELQLSGLSWQATQSEKPPQAEAESTPRTMKKRTPRRRGRESPSR